MIKIQVLEQLHQNTNRLILYVLRDVFSMALDFSFVVLILGILSKLAKHPLQTRQLVFWVSIALSSSWMGNVYRLRTMVNDLMDYDEAIARLRAKQKAKTV